MASFTVVNRNIAVDGESPAEAIAPICQEEEQTGEETAEISRYTANAIDVSPSMIRQPKFTIRRR